MRRLRRDLGRRLNLDLDARELLVELADLEGRKRLEESGAVVRAGAVAHLDHLLRELAVELRRGVREVRLDVDLCGNQHVSRGDGVGSWGRVGLYAIDATQKWRRVGLYAIDAAQK